LEAVRGLLDNQTALLEYALSKEGSFLFVVTREGVHSFRLPPAGEINQLVQDVRAVIGQRPGPRLAQYREFTTYVKVARQLYEMLIAPASEVLTNKRHLLIAPDGGLYYLPFEALLTEEVKLRGADYRGLAYVLKQWEISYAPSASVLASLRQRRPRAEPQTATAKTFLGFGDPVYELGPETSDFKPKTQDPRPKTQDPRPKTQERRTKSNRPQTTDHGPRTSSVVETLRSVFEESGQWQLQPLKDSGREVTGIAGLYKPNDFSIHLRSAAREENVKSNEHLSAARRVHFATHGMISEQQPQYSSLVLTLDEDPNEDGLLQVHEIFNLKLSADLVVLSACRTGLGKEVRGEGMIGLTRAFLYAGASSVVVSLWSVVDRSTAGLMMDFYERLDRVSDKAAALQQAKLKMMQTRRYAHPYYWAPFVLVGEQK
jgi:CHAT domain-containing protein